jgi:hypothetical protein
MNQERAEGREGSFIATRGGTLVRVPAFVGMFRGAEMLEETGTVAEFFGTEWTGVDVLFNRYLSFLR